MLLIRYILSFSLFLLPFSAVAVDVSSVSWPLPSSKPWSNVVLSPHDLIKNEFRSTMESLGDILLGGQEGDPVVSIESGVVTFAHYSYHPSWRTSIGGDDLNELTNDVRSIQGADLKAIHIMMCVTNLKGEAVYYSGLAIDQPLPKTGSKVISGQVLGRLGHAYPNLGANLSLQGSNGMGQNRLLALLKAPYPLLPVSKPRSRADRVPRVELWKDIDVFWGALRAYYPGLYDQTPRKALEMELSDYRDRIPTEGLSVGDFADRLRNFLRFFSDNHMSVWESANSNDTKFLPVGIGAIDDRLFVTSSQVRSLPVGAQIASIDGILAKDIVIALWSQGGRSDGSLGSWEKETLSRNAGTLWTRTTGHHAGDKIKISLSNGETSTVTLTKRPVAGWSDWWTQVEKSCKSRGETILGFEDTPNISIRRISPDTDAITLWSFQWSDVEKDMIDRYFSGGSSPAPSNLILDLRFNPGGEELTEWKFLGYFTRKDLPPFIAKTVVQTKLSSAAGARNLLNNDENTFSRYAPDEYGTYRTTPNRDETIPKREKGTFDGRLIILTSGMTGSAAFDATRVLKSAAGAILVGRPGPHGTNRMIAEKFAQVYLPASGLNCQIPMVKIVTEQGGDIGPPVPLSVDYPVEITLELILQEQDPEWDLAIELSKAEK